MITPARSEAEALQRLREMAFGHYNRCSAAVRALCRQSKRIDRHPKGALVWNVYDWLLAPLTLWPLDIGGLALHLAQRLKVGHAFDADLELLLEALERPPGPMTQEAICGYEKRVSAGEYDSLVKQPQKFQEQEARLGRDKALGTVWSKIKTRFRVRAYEVNKLHVIRRSMSQERNFRPDLQFRWNNKRERFTQIFDAVCHRWHLYGFQGDKPLLLKISVNPTPHGTMIVIPRHWSFDKARDLDWKAISDLHKAHHGPGRQGPKLSSGRVEKLVLRDRVKYLMAEAACLGLRGEAKNRFLCRGMNRVYSGDMTWLKRLLRGQSVAAGNRTVEFPRASSASSLRRARVAA